MLLRLHKYSHFYLYNNEKYRIFSTNSYILLKPPHFLPPLQAQKNNISTRQARNRSKS